MDLSVLAGSILFGRFGVLFVVFEVRVGTEFRQFDGRELNLIEGLRSLRIMHYAAWIARRWEDPAFHIAFPWFDTDRYWDEHILTLREQAALMEEEPLAWQVSGNRA